MSGTKDVEITSNEDITKMMQTIEATRTAKGHLLNDRSSRSHCIITLKLSYKKGNKLINSKFIIADLAGSERVYKSGVIDNLDLRVEEAKNINTSLSALGRIVAMMGTASKGAYMPFRDSALTMLLKESLTGNVRTALVVAVSSSPAMIHETMSSLKFGTSCGNVKTKVAPRTVNAGDQVVQYEQALKQCTAQLKVMESQGFNGGFNPDAPKCTKDAFSDNYRKLIAEKAAMDKVQSKIVRSAKGEDISALQTKKVGHVKQINHFKGMLVR